MTYIRLAWAVLYVVFAFAAFTAVNRDVTFLCMDEFFHVGQTLRYAIHHDFWTWDQKITTPPGLYILGFVIVKLFGPHIWALRGVNTAALLGLSWFVAPDPLIVLGFPLLSFYSNLYYTDILSTLLVLGGFQASSPLISSALLFSSLWFRQTNIVWAGLVAVFRIARNTPLVRLWSARRTLFRDLCREAPPYLAIAGAFCVFLKWNGGIALGDKSNHEVSLHGAQVLYYLLFSCFFAAPLVLRWVLSGRVFRKLSWVPLEVALIYLLIRYGTVVHPFILADNRHYTFYLWRRLITPCRGLLLIPGYWVSWRWLLASVDLSLVVTWAFFAATLLVLVPSPLMEPRYYIVPYLVWRLFLYKKRAGSLEYGWYLALNAITVYIFCRSSTHFMW